MEENRSELVSALANEIALIKDRQDFGLAVLGQFGDSILRNTKNISKLRTKNFLLTLGVAAALAISIDGYLIAVRSRDAKTSHIDYKELAADGINDAEEPED